MPWSIHQIDGCAVYSLAVSDKTAYQLKNSLSDFLGKLGDVIREQCLQLEWTRLMLEVWGDSGRIIGYPVMVDGRRPIVVQVEIQYLLDRWNSLPDPDDDLSAFEYQSRQIEIEIGGLVLSASARNPGKTSLNNLKAVHLFETYMQFADDVGTAGPISVV